MDFLEAGCSNWHAALEMIRKNNQEGASVNEGERLQRLFLHMCMCVLCMCIVYVCRVCVRVCVFYTGGGNDDGWRAKERLRQLCGVLSR